MKLLNILLLAYLLLIIADDFTVWAFNKRLGKLIGSRDVEDLPRSVHQKAMKVVKAKRTTRTAIRVLQVLILVAISSAIIVIVGTLIINF